MKKRKFGSINRTFTELGLDLQKYPGDEVAKTLLRKAVKSGIRLIRLPIGWQQTSLAMQIMEWKKKEEPSIANGDLVEDIQIVMDIPKNVWMNEQKAEASMIDGVDIVVFREVDTQESLTHIRQCALFQLTLEKRDTMGKLVMLASQDPRVARIIAENRIADGILLTIHPIYDLLDAEILPDHQWDEENFNHPYLNMNANRQQLYEICTREGIGILAENVTGDGRLLTAESSPGKVGLSLLQCIHYALQRPGVTGALLPAKNVEELEQILEYEGASHAMRDFASRLIRFSNMTWRGRCMYCENCQPCPMKVEITEVMQSVNLMNAQDVIPKAAEEMYRKLKCGARTCFDCGTCETRCPFSVPIRVNLKKALDAFDE